ncbi:hypothetical protein CesoFtcFv8_008218 [Champsocephalus esox]|uniref:Heme-binding protein 1 n=1 Tax=Champsocephalus esox TaxID=159716 RepID=A0AAN8C800_9TELE|nr:hypothetical protein CesoFtcFv8_008218 [Champsocephalus esox]
MTQLKVIACPVISPSPSSLQSECSRLQSLLLSPPCRWTSTMAFVSVFAFLTLAVAAEGNVGPSSNRSFCTESKECLEYQLVCKTDEYEVRHYSPTRWVSTDAEAYFMGVGAAMAFRRLFQFITGANVGGVQMEMTAPVLVKIPEDTRMWEPAVYTLSFPLPAAYQEEPPAPTNDKLYFTEMPEMDVYVRGYGGWMLSVTSRLHAHLLTKELGRVGASYNRSYHYGVGYDSPLKLLNRHNEVWYVSEGDVVCSDPQQPTPPHTPSPTPSPSPTDPTSIPPRNTSNPPGDSTTLLPDAPPGNSTTLLPDAPPGDSTTLLPDAPPGDSTTLLPDAPLGDSTTLLPSLTSGGPSADAPPEEAH